MSKLLLLVQSEADVQHLDGAAQAILNSAITGVWVVFSPAITVNASEAAGKLDTEIEALRTAEDQAAGRRDYAAAAGYKTQREGKELDRQKALRDAWKTAPAEERKKKAQEAFAPLIAQLQPNGVNVKITAHGDHYDRDQWVAMLNSLTGAWFKEFTPGSFVVGWPEAVATSLKNIVPASFKKGMEDIATGNTVPLEKALTEAPPKSRREELEALHPMKLGPLMRNLELNHEGLSRAQKIEAILAAEEKKTEPALAEY